jgi:hypothetical protein
MADDDDQELDPEGLDPNIREAIRLSERKAKKADQEAESLRRELAFAKAGIPDTPLTTTLAKSYDGENDPTAIKAYFEGLGVEITGASAGTPLQGGPPPGPSDAELAAQRQVADLGGGAEGDGSIPYEDYLTSAKSQDELMRRIREAPQGATDSNGFQITVPEIQ